MRTAASLLSFSCLASLSALVSTVRHGAHPAVDVDGDGERAQHVDVDAVVQRALARGRDDDVARAELHVRGGEQSADRVGVGAHPLTGAVDHEGDLGARGGSGLLDDPGAAEGGEDHHHGHPEHPGGGEEAVAPAAAGRGADGRALLEQVGDRPGAPPGLGSGSQVAASWGSARAGDGAELASATAR